MKKLIFKALGITLLLLSPVIGWFVYDYQLYLTQAVSLDKQRIDFEILPGTSLRKLVQELSAKKVISRPHYFQWHARLNHPSLKIYSGEYSLPPGGSPRDLLKMLASGKVKTYSLTLVEGWTFKQVVEAVRNHSGLKKELVERLPQDIMKKLGLPGIDPEGRFYPDTYHFPKHTTDVEFLKRAYKAMQTKLNAEWEKRPADTIIKTPYEALILASVVERETAVAAERGKIAGVFVRRLKIGMRLQSDPTVIYGMGDKYNGNITRADLRRDTPHNTYTRSGLPVTPIAMPSAKAIEAVLNPEPGKALYFVARGDGSHEFSDNLKQHNQAVIKYQLKGKTKSFSSYRHVPESTSNSNNKTKP